MRPSRRRIRASCHSSSRLLKACPGKIRFLASSRGPRHSFLPTQHNKQNMILRLVADNAVNSSHNLASAACRPHSLERLPTSQDQTPTLTMVALQSVLPGLSKHKARTQAKRAKAWLRATISSLRVMSASEIIIECVRGASKLQPCLYSTGLGRTIRRADSTVGTAFSCAVNAVMRASPKTCH